MNKLVEITEKWKGLERSTEEKRKEADEFYDREIMPIVMKNFKENECNKVSKNSKYMIISVGTSYQPIVLSLITVRPEKILFLYTKKTEVELDKIVELTNIKPSNFQKVLVEKANALTIYKEIKDIYLSWNNPEQIYIDFTGGTKAMSAATAMAGTVIDAQLIYVNNSNYLRDFNKPEPGTEYLELIPNPYAVFGDIDKERAFDLFEQHDYASARKIFQELMKKVPDAENRNYYKLLYLLASSYENWDAIDFKEAVQYMSDLIKEIEKDSKVNNRIILCDKVNILKKQFEILNRLCRLSNYVRNKKTMEFLLESEDITSLIVSIVENAKRRKSQERYDMAALLLYRILEMIMQRRLALYGIYASNPNYKEAFPNNKKQEDFKKTVIEIRKRIYGKKISFYLPDSISLMEGYIQLTALKDELMDKQDKMKFLEKLRGSVSIRNHSIFAHGYRTIDENEYVKFKKFVMKIFYRYCTVEDIDRDYWESITVFINPKETKYCQ